MELDSTIETRTFLHFKWCKLCCELGVENRDLISEKFKELYEDYSRPHRYYHAPQHIVQCLYEFEKAKHLSGNPLAVKFALFGHDKFYDVTRDDNEFRSGAWARDTALEMGSGVNFALCVHNLILPTDHKLLPPLSIDAKITVDIDLSFLGAYPEIFDENTEKIAREYLEVLNITRKQFNAGRVKWMESMLLPNRPYIYSTDFFSKKYEAQAQENLKRALKELKTGA